MTIYEMLRSDHPALLERHVRGWRYHRFGEQPDTHEPITEYLVPTYSEVDGVLSNRYLRQYIEIAHAEDPERCPLDDIDRKRLKRSTPSVAIPVWHSRSPCNRVRPFLRTTTP
jgi:hypothetical protein